MAGQLSKLNFTARNFGHVTRENEMYLFHCRGYKFPLADNANNSGFILNEKISLLKAIPSLDEIAKKSMNENVAVVVDKYYDGLSLALAFNGEVVWTLGYEVEDCQKELEKYIENGLFIAKSLEQLGQVEVLANRGYGLPDMEFSYVADRVKDGEGKIWCRVWEYSQICSGTIPTHFLPLQL